MSKYIKKCCLLALLVFSFILGLHLSSFKNYHEVLPLSLTDESFPCIKVSIGDSSYPLILDLGSRLELALNKEEAKKTNKIPYGLETWKNFRGKEFKTPTYQLPKIQIGNIVFKKPIMIENPSAIEDNTTIWQSPDYVPNPENKPSGDIGLGLIKKTNLLIDVGRKKAIFSNQPKKIKKEGYDLHSFDKVPFKLMPKGIFIEVDTDIGYLTLLVDTGCTWTLLHESLYPKNTKKITGFHNLPIFTSKRFSMNGFDFGSHEICFINTPRDSTDFDGILGMDFFKKHVVYIDFPNKIMYLKKLTKVTTLYKKHLRD